MIIYKKKIHSLRRVKVCLQSEIKSQFIDTRKEMDITKNPCGSLCVFDLDQMNIFLKRELPPFSSYAALVPYALNTYLNGTLQDLLPISQMLSYPTQHIHSILDLVNITPFDPTLNDHTHDPALL